MPDETVKVLLTKFGLDTTDWKKGVAEIRKQLKDFQTEQKKKADEARQQLEVQKAKLKELSIQHKQIAVDQQKQTAEQRKQIGDVQILIQQTKAKYAQEQVTTAEMQRQTAEIQKQIAALRLRKAQETTPSGKGHEAPGIFDRILSGMMRGGVAGSIRSVAGGVLGGGLALEGVNYAIEKFRELSEGIKQAGEEASLEAQQEVTLDAVAGKRIKSMEEFVLSMRDATMHLADDSMIFSVATQAFRGNSKVTAEQIVELSHDAVKLGVAAHGPQGVGQALNAVSQYFISGRSYALAYALGLSSADRMLLMGGQRQQSVTQQLASMNQMLERVHKTAEKIPEPLETVALAQEQYKTTLEHLEHELASIVQTSPGLVGMWQSLAELLEDFLKKFDTNKEEFKKSIDAFLGVVNDAAVGITEIIALIIPWIGTLLSAIPALGAAMHLSSASMSEAETDAIQHQLTAVNHALGTKSPEEAKKYFSRVGGKFQPAPGASDKAYQTALQAEKADLEGRLVASRMVTEKENEMANAAGKAAEDLKHASNQVGAALSTMAARMSDIKGVGRLKGVEGEVGDEGVSPLSFEQQIKITQGEIKNRAEQREIDLEDEKNKLTASLKLKQDALKDGLILEDQYAQDVKVIYKKIYENELAVLRNKRDAEVKALATTGEDARVVHPQVEKAFLDEKKGKQQALAQYQESLRVVDEQVRTEKRAAAISDLDFNKQQLQADLAANKQAVEQKYADGLIGINARQQAEREYYATLAVALLQYEDTRIKLGGMSEAQIRELHKQTEAQFEALNRQYLANEDKTQKERRALIEHTDQIRIAEAQNAYQEVQNLISLGGVSPVAGRTLTQGALNEQIAAQEAKRSHLKAQLNVPGRSPLDETSAEYIRLTTALEDTDKALNKFRTDLERQPSTSQLLVGQLGQLLQAAFPKVAGPIGDLFGALQSGFDTGPGSAKDNLDIALNDLADGSWKSAKGLSDLAQAIGPVVSGVSGLVNVIGNPNLSVGKSILQGATAGAQIGSVGGIWGTVVGAAVGGLIGAISGIFQRAARRIAEEVQNSIIVITKNFQQGSATLATTVTALEKLRADAIARLSHKSGGKGQLNKILPSLDAEIAQLQLQQRQIINSFNANVALMNLGTGFQDFGSEIQGIIQQWNDYVSAGGSVATANQFLTDSFKNLDENALQQLDQSYQDAIQNALSYSQLLYQEAQLADQTAMSIRNIKNQGVLVRQTTTAQSKAYQIQLIQQQAAQQKEQLDEQLKVAKYKLDTESKIFDLTGSRVDLENKLAAVQMGVIDYDMVRIKALKELTTSYSATGVPMGSLIMSLVAALTAAGPGGTPIASSYDQLLQELGLAPPVRPNQAPASTALQGLTQAQLMILARYGSYVTPTNK